MPLIWEQTANLGDWYFSFSFLTFLSVGKAAKLVWTDCEGLCWNLAGQRLGEQPHADSYSAGQFSASFGSFTQPCTQWLHKADYKLQRIPEGAKSDAGANEPREPLIPGTEWDKLGKARTTQIQGAPGSSEPALGTRGHYPFHSAGPQQEPRWHRPSTGDSSRDPAPLHLSLLPAQPSPGPGPEQGAALPPPHVTSLLPQGLAWHRTGSGQFPSNAISAPPANTAQGSGLQSSRVKPPRPNLDSSALMCKGRVAGRISPVRVPILPAPAQEMPPMMAGPSEPALPRGCGVARSGGGPRAGLGIIGGLPPAPPGPLIGLPSPAFPSARRRSCSLLCGVINYGPSPLSITGKSAFPIERRNNQKTFKAGEAGAGALTMQPGDCRAAAH